MSAASKHRAALLGLAETWSTSGDAQHTIRHSMDVLCGALAREEPVTASALGDALASLSTHDHLAPADLDKLRALLADGGGGATASASTGRFLRCGV
jgi:hypothetical protein